MTRTTQLRRYEVKPHLLEDFLAWWPTKLVPAREAHGFTVEFGYVDRANSGFTWAVSIDGDAEEFARVEAAYNASAERAAAFEGLTEAWNDAAHLSLVERIL